VAAGVVAVSVAVGVFAETTSPADLFHAAQAFLVARGLGW
jgi:hypothetical protein